MKDTERDAPVFPKVIFPTCKYDKLNSINFVCIGEVTEISWIPQNNLHLKPTIECLDTTRSKWEHVFLLYFFFCFSPFFNLLILSWGQTCRLLLVVLWLFLGVFLKIKTILLNKSRKNYVITVLYHVLMAMRRQVSYSLKTAVRTWQPLPFCQHLHQSDDSHLTVGSTNHTEEQLCGRGKGQVTTLIH